MSILDGRKKENILAAVNEIKAGGVVGIPTETVYGLAADAFNDEAVKKIFEIKGRPLADPLILHVADESMLRFVTHDISPMAHKLIEKFWPGPLTLILNKTSKVSPLITAGRETVAVRMPRNLIALALIKNSQTILAAPSANKFQGLSPTTAEAVEESLGNRVGIILDGGPSLIGIESTIVDLTNVVEGPRVLRWGGVTKEQLEDVIGQEIEGPDPIHSASSGEGLLAPGMLSFHYAPKKALELYTLPEVKNSKSLKFDETDIWLCYSPGEERVLQELGAKNIFSLSHNASLEEASKNYFETLRKIDQLENVGVIRAVTLPNEGLGRAINDRLKKAQHK